MVYKVIKVKTKKDIKEFIRLPKRLYKRKFRTQRKSIEKQILLGRHSLSTTFKAIGFIVKDTHNKVLSRCVLTMYPNESVAYIGFFESYNCVASVKELIRVVSKYAEENGRNKLIGPVDSSFWIKYRFKVNKFNKIYTGEPYNLRYYVSLWEKSGFKVSEQYYSNQLRVPDSTDINEKCKSRLELVNSKGYTIRNTSRKTFTTDLENIYHLLSKLYSNFPVYKQINIESFIKMYSSIRWILDYRMVFLAYKNDVLAGFMICFPNYSEGSMLKHLMGNHTEYVMMYLGVDSGHYGLGGAFSELCRNFLEEHKCTCIPALIHTGNKSGTFYKELAIDRYDYILMEKSI